MALFASEVCRKASGTVRVGDPPNDAECADEEAARRTITIA